MIQGIFDRFGHRKSSGLTPSSTAIPGQAPANTPATNVIAGPSNITNNGISAGPVHATGNQPANSQPPVTPVPVKNQAFRKAIEEYIDHLSDDDKLAFQSATDVLEKMEELQKRKSSISTSHATCKERVQKVLQSVKQFLASITICIQHHPEISSLVVGGVHCILGVSPFFISFLILCIISNIDLFLLDSLR